jgi:zinc transporter, ZIP family
LPDQFSASLPFILLATGAGILGSLIALFWNPKARMRSAIQHFAAGAVLAAVASNVIPEVEQLGSLTGVASGFVVGGLVMIGLKWVVVRLEREEKRGRGLPVGLSAAAAVDTLLDGVIIGAGFSVDQHLGTLLVIALGLELLFLTLSVGVELREAKLEIWKSLAITVGIACMLLVGAFGSSFFLANASKATLAVVLAFGAAALIYLIAEELLVETIQAEESIFSTIMLFAGFLVLMVLKLIEPG